MFPSVFTSRALTGTLYVPSVKLNPKMLCVLTNAAAPVMVLSETKLMRAGLWKTRVASSSVRETLSPPSAAT